MKKNLLLSIFLSLLLLPVIVQAESISITVKGMVCSFCAQGIKKTFLKNQNVKEVKVDLESKLVSVQTIEGAAISDEEVKQIITDAGYEVLAINRGPHA